MALNWPILTIAQWAAMTIDQWAAMLVVSPGPYIVDRIHVFVPGAVQQHAVPNPVHRPVPDGSLT